MNHYNPTNPFAQGEVENRVKLGVELLDEHYDRWEDAINLEALDLENAYLCVLGQIGSHSHFSGNRDFHTMLPLVFANTEPEHMDRVVYEHGFDIIGAGEYWSEEYDALEKAWTSAITERKNR